MHLHKHNALPCIVFDDVDLEIEVFESCVQLKVFPKSYIIIF